MDSSIDCFSSVFADLHAARNSYNTGRILNHRSFGAAFTQIHKIQPAFIDALLFLTLFYISVFQKEWTLSIPTILDRMSSLRHVIGTF
ncbi:hypothetical protein T4E_826 [Trichinella pseudospiralis]|uniref:Uncharacterized protein n=1 Tax=Trichinella pseudospiralis TaxID=6337 RepID=A0A0V0YK38_TRIPS|nr:hypothetical protein T4E_826 [Trichinella pseudospiralis]